VRFFPLSVESFVFPTDYKVVVCNSLRQAQKANGAKSIFNERVATYEIAMLLIKQLFPNLAGRLVHLRDLNTDHLGINEAELYQVVAALPERVTREILYGMLPAHTNRLDQLFRTHETALLEPLMAFLKSREDIRIVGPATIENRAPIVSILPKKKTVLEVYNTLTRHRLMLGYGNFYAYRPLMDMDIPTDPGGIRISFVHYTSPEEIQQVITGLEKALD
jgi:hypothetical protein